MGAALFRAGDRAGEGARNCTGGITEVGNAGEARGVSGLVSSLNDGERDWEQKKRPGVTVEVAKCRHRHLLAAE